VKPDHLAGVADDLGATHAAPARGDENVAVTVIGALLQHNDRRRLAPGRRARGSGAAGRPGQGDHCGDCSGGRVWRFAPPRARSPARDAIVSHRLAPPFRQSSPQQAATLPGPAYPQLPALPRLPSRCRVAPAWKAATIGAVTSISPCGRCWLCPRVTGDCRWFTARSGTQRARLSALRDKFQMPLAHGWPRKLRETFPAVIASVRIRRSGWPSWRGIARVVRRCSKGIRRQRVSRPRSTLDVGAGPWRCPASTGQDRRYTRATG
jgi:hypothetical protein